MQGETIVLDRRQKRRLAGEYPDLCLTCGTCAGGCPVTGVDGLDMRKAVRMALLGLDQELVDSRFPWICTICGRCEQACPMNIDLNKMMRSARTLRERDKVPGVMHKGVEMCLKTGNNVGIPTEDFLFLLEDLGAELAEELPGFETPVPTSYLAQRPPKRKIAAVTIVRPRERTGQPGRKKNRPPPAPEATVKLSQWRIPAEVTWKSISHSRMREQRR